MYKKLFEPIKIGSLKLKNRMVVPAMVTNYANHDGTASETFIAYHEAKAKGGWGLIITENYCISPEAGGFYNLPGLWEDSLIESHKKLTDRIHAVGGRIAAQIYHAGRETTSVITGVQPVAPSALKDPTMPETPRELTVPEIEEIVEKFGDTAFRAKKAGFDAVEIHGAHGYLINQFLSPFSNKRIDEYGGTIEGRTKFALEVIKNVRSKVGEDYPLIFRMSTVEYVEGGLEIEESKAIARMIEKAGVNAVHCSQGVYKTSYNIIPPYAVPRAAFVNNAAEIKKVVNIPVIAVGRINEPSIAEAVILSGKADLVSMGRASIADPELPNKIREGRFSDMQFCIGCMQGCSGECGKGNPIQYLYHMAKKPA